jgi:hypothetical protein
MKTRFWQSLIFTCLLFTVVAKAQNGPGLAAAWTSNGNGTFTVRSSSPWSSYSYPNGVWLSGDFNADGRSDFVHAVQNTDYVHTWLSQGNGTFNVSTFRPWPGYGIPNGLWMTADFNGDGRSDILHAVQNRDYVHTWLSQGNGTFNVTTFRPWPGYGIPNGVWVTGDFNADGRADVLHAVQNTDYVHTWLSQGNGTFNVTTFRPWQGYGIPNGQWLTGDYNGDGRTDIVHAVHNTDYVHTWLSQGNGTFNVTTFRPWQGYGIPNGVWLTGDHNGDGRTDIVHAVHNTDYVHTWLSQGNGAFNVTTFRPWQGYGIPNGSWATGDFNADNRSDVIHAVANSDYVHTWLSQSNGTFNVTTFRPWTGYPISAGLFRISDFSGDNRRDFTQVLSIQPARFLQVSRFTTTVMNDAAADTALTDATRVLWTNDVAGDIVCNVRLARSGTVNTFAQGNGIINSNADFNTIVGLPGFVKVVNQINWCGAIIPNVIGCAPTPGGSLIVIRFAQGTIQEGILWAHEYGHTRGLPHRAGATTVMNATISGNQLAVNVGECNLFDN